MKIENSSQINPLSFSELHPTIQLWIDSDEFIDSLVYVMQEFAILEAAPLTDSILELILKKIKPEEFKDRLLSLLPLEKRSGAIVEKLINSSLLPIKAPLAESGIDISMIAQLDETPAVSYALPVLEALVEETKSESLITPLGEADTLPPSAVLVESTNLAMPEPLIVSINKAPTSSHLIASLPSMPTETVIISESITPPSNIIPIYPTKPTPNESATISSFSHSIDVSTSSASINESASINKPSIVSTPFVIHQEKPIERASQGLQHKEELLRPLFYSKEEKQESPSFVNLEFKRPITNDDTNPQDA